MDDAVVEAPPYPKPGGPTIMVKVPASVPNETVAPLDEWEPKQPSGLKMEAKDKP